MNKFKFIKLSQIAAFVAVLAVVGFSASLLSCSNAKGQGEKEVASASVLVEVLKAEKSVREAKRRFSGYSHPWDSNGIGFLVAGRITSVNVHEGQYVKRGQLLATIDPEDYKLVEELARTQRTAIEPNFERVDKLVGVNALPQSELDKIKGQYNAAKTQEIQAKRQVHYTRLYAPVNGVVHEVRTSVGQVIGQGLAAIVLLQLDTLKVKFGITQTDLDMFEQGQEMQIDFPGVMDDIAAEVWHIDYVADSLTRTYNVIFEVDNKEHKLRPSMLAHLDLIEQSYEGFFVPINALMHNKTGKFIVYTVDLQSKIVKEVLVQKGKRFDEMIEISSGLSGGEQVVVMGNNFITQGDKVEIR